MDVHSESLQNLLVSLRQHTSPLPAIPALPALHRGDVIEIQGPASSGKTHLLYHILVSLLVPVPSDADVQIAAIVYDTDTSFDIQRFRSLLLSRIFRLPSSALDPHEVVRRSLARLHIFRPASLVQLAASIANLPAYHASHMPNQEVAVLAVDSISPFYWVDRFSAEQLRNIVPERLTPLHHVWIAIQAVCRSHGPLTILTNWALNSAPSHSELLYKQHLHPFPALEDRTADLGAKAPNVTFSSPLRLAHQIALSFPSSNPSPVMPPDNAQFHETHHEGITCGLSRSSETLGTVRFNLQITDVGILVQPQ